MEGERLGQEERGEEASWHNLGNYNFVTAWRGTGHNIELILDFPKREKFFFSLKKKPHLFIHFKALHFLLTHLIELHL